MFKKIINIITGYFHPGKKPRRVHEVISAKKADQLRRQKEIGREIPKPVAKRPSPVEELPVLPKAETTEALEELTPAHIEITREEPISKGTEVAAEPKEQVFPFVEEFRDQTPLQPAEDVGRQVPPLPEEIAKKPERQVVEIQAPPKEKRLINLGIDFGTSGTKVIYRDITGRKSWVCSFDNGLKNYPDYVLPSSLRVVDGRIYFGGEAERRASYGAGIRSFKICMICQSGGLPSRSCNLVFDHYSHPEPHNFQFRLKDGNIHSASPIQLGTYYLAYVIQHAKNLIEDQFSKDYALNITYNMCVPVSYIVDENLYSGFNRCLFMANQLSGFVRDGGDLCELDRIYKELNSEFPTIPNSEARPTFVQPETITAVFQYVMSPAAEAGLYGVVDVGAGTTDISFFRLSTFPEEMILAIYDAQTHLVGANEIDNGLLDCLADKGALPENISDRTRNEWRQQLRILKHRISEVNHIKIKTPKGEFTISNEDFERVSLPIGKQVFVKYQETWRKAYKKEVNENKWKEYTLFLIGGGSKIQSISSEIAKKPWDRIDKIKLRRLKVPPDLVFGKIQHENLEDSFHLLAIAYGLSYHPAMYPDIKYPNQVPEMKPRSPIRDLPPWYQYWEQD
jgi:hypothetical protein